MILTADMDMAENCPLSSTYHLTLSHLQFIFQACCPSVSQSASA